VGYDNFIPVHVAGRDGCRLRVRLESGAHLTLPADAGHPAPGCVATLAARSERIALATCTAAHDGENWLRGRVVRVQSLGRWLETTVDCGGAAILVRSQAPAAMVGEAVALRLPGDTAILAEGAVG
jgi:hypothetical protein